MGKKYHISMECMHTDGTSHFESRFIHARNQEAAKNIMFNICKFLGFTSIREINISSKKYF